MNPLVAWLPAHTIRQLEADLSAREAALAAASELTSTDSRVQAAFRDGQHLERQRILTLINMQIETLSRGGLSHTVLSTLQRMVQADS